MTLAIGIGCIATLAMLGLGVLCVPRVRLTDVEEPAKAGKRARFKGVQQ